MTATKSIKQVRADFSQGEMVNITGLDPSAVLMERDIKHISDEINEELIQPVIDFIIASDDILLDGVVAAVDKAEEAAEAVKDAYDLADKANNNANDALSEAADAFNKAEEAKVTADALKPRVEALEADFVDVSKKAGDAYDKAIQNETDISAIGSRIDGVDKTVSGNTEEIRNIRDRIDGLQDEINAERERVESLRDDTNGLKDTVSVHDERLTETNARIDSIITDFDDKVKDFVTETEVNDKLTPINSEISDIKRDMLTASDVADFVDNTTLADAIKDFVTDADLSEFITAPDVENQITARTQKDIALKSELIDFITMPEVEAKGYITNAEIANFVTAADVDQKIADGDFASKTELTEAIKDFVSETDIDNKITEATKDFLTGSEIDDRITDKIDEVNSNINDYNNRITELEKLPARVEGVEDRLDGLDTLLNDYADVKLAATTAKADVEDLIDNKIPAIESAIGSVESTANANASEITTIKQNMLTVDNVKQEIDDKLIPVNNNISSLQNTKLDKNQVDAAIDAKISDALDDITQLEGDVNDLEGRVSTNEGNITNLQTDKMDRTEFGTEFDKALTSKDLVTNTELTAKGYITNAALAGLATETYVDNAVSTKANASDLTALVGRVTETELDISQLNQDKADKQTVADSLALKADKTELNRVEGLVNGKVSAAEVEDILTAKDYTTLPEVEQQGYLKEVDVNLKLTPITDRLDAVEPVAEEAHEWADAAITDAGTAKTIAEAAKTNADDALTRAERLLLEISNYYQEQLPKSRDNQIVWQDATGGNNVVRHVSPQKPNRITVWPMKYARKTDRANGKHIYTVKIREVVQIKSLKVFGSAAHSGRQFINADLNGSITSFGILKTSGFVLDAYKSRGWNSITVSPWLPHTSLEKPVIHSWHVDVGNSTLGEIKFMIQTNEEYAQADTGKPINLMIEGEVDIYDDGNAYADPLDVFGWGAEFTPLFKPYENPANYPGLPTPQP